MVVKALGRCVPTKTRLPESSRWTHGRWLPPRAGKGSLNPLPVLPLAKLAPPSVEYVNGTAQRRRSDRGVSHVSGGKRESAQRQRVRQPSHTTPITLRSDTHISSAEMQSRARPVQARKAERLAAALTVTVDIRVLPTIGHDPLAPGGREEGCVPPDCRINVELMSN